MLGCGGWLNSLRQRFSWLKTALRRSSDRKASGRSVFRMMTIGVLYS